MVAEKLWDMNPLDKLYKDMTDGDLNINIKVCKQPMRTLQKRIRKMAKEHFKFDFEEWMAEELIYLMIGKIGMKLSRYSWEVNTIERGYVYSTIRHIFRL